MIPGFLSSISTHSWRNCHFCTTRVNSVIGLSSTHHWTSKQEDESDDVMFPALLESHFYFSLWIIISWVSTCKQRTTEREQKLAPGCGVCVHNITEMRTDDLSSATMLTPYCVSDVHVNDEVSLLVQGFILKLQVFGAPPDTICFEDSIYWEVSLGETGVSPWIISFWVFRKKEFCYFPSLQTSGLFISWTCRRACNTTYCNKFIFEFKCQISQIFSSKLHCSSC